VSDPSAYPQPEELKKRREREHAYPDVVKELKQRAELTSPQLIRLADKLGVPVEELYEKIDKDTLRRLKYPLRETDEPDGSRQFEDPIMVQEGIRSETRGDKGKTHPVEPERDEEGKFTK
jgi:hypothetical protein